MPYQPGEDVNESQEPREPQGAPDRNTTLRITPYEAAFAETAYEAEVFPAIEADARAHGSDPLGLDSFAMLPATSEAVRSFVPPEAPAEALEQYRALLYHGFNYWHADYPSYLVHPAVARFLVESQPAMQGWELVVPDSSVYVQLPHNLFWGSVSPEMTPEPIDGFFVTAAPETTTPGASFLRLEVLLVLGLRRDRAGFSVIPFQTEAGPGIASVWAEGNSREGGTDFENILPGGEISGLYSVLTVGEVLKLLGRIFWYIDRFPAAVSVSETSDPAAEESASSAQPTASRLPFHLVSLDAGGSDAPSS